MNKSIYPNFKTKLAKPKSFTLRTTITLSQDDLNHTALINLLNRTNNKAQLVRTLMLRGLAEFVKDEIINEAK